MRSPSFKRALRATIRACVVAITASNSAYADWNASLISIPASCVVHDSGMEFLPLRFRAIAELGSVTEHLQPKDSAFELSGTVEMFCETTTNHCVLAAMRHANYEQLSSRIEWARHEVGWFYSVASEWIDHYPLLPLSWNRAIRANSPFVATHIVRAFDAPNLQPVDSYNQIDVIDETTGDLGELPSGHPANIFVFTLETTGQTDKPDQADDSTAAFDALVDRSLSAAIASRIGRPEGDWAIGSQEGEHSSELVSGTEVDAPMCENRFPIEEGCIPSSDFLPGVLSDTVAGDGNEGIPEIATAPEHLVKTLKDGLATVSVVPDPIADLADVHPAITPESELCLPLTSSCGDGRDRSDYQEVVTEVIETNGFVPDTLPIDPALSMAVDETSESWRSLFRPHGCIFAPEYLIDQPSVGIRANTEIEPNPMEDELRPAAPLNRDFVAVDAALRDPVGIGLELPRTRARWNAIEPQESISSESVRWSESAWVGYANDRNTDDNNHSVGFEEQARYPVEISRTPMTKFVAQGLRWFGDWMVQWSEALESQIRMAEGSERAATHER